MSAGFKAGKKFTTRIRAVIDAKRREVLWEGLLQAQSRKGANGKKVPFDLSDDSLKHRLPRRVLIQCFAESIGPVLV
mgnify:CR=1 FL=1